MSNSTNEIILNDEGFQDYFEKKEYTKIFR